mgnify:CR=1 FL=1
MRRTMVRAHREEARMADSVYKVIELVGTSAESFEGRSPQR